MKTLLDSNDREFLERLHRLGAATVQEMCADLGVTATAVRQRLTRLGGLGLVSREVVRTGRRPPPPNNTVDPARGRARGGN
jgi:predicted ArsR family transcriptional regulator